MADGVLSIGELARRAGVSESTLRAWERRYGLLAPDRTAGGHRRYSLDDVGRIEDLLALVSSGYSVDAAAERIREGERDPGRAARVPAGEPADEVDAHALTLAYRTALRLLELRGPEEASEVLGDLVTALGGTVVAATDAGDDALPIDLSFGYGPPVLPSAAPMSFARMRIEFVLPQLLEGARSVVALLRRLEAPDGASGDDQPR